MPSSRYGSYSTGRTRRSLPTPMFFIARIVAAMLIGFCGSYRTMTTESRSTEAGCAGSGTDTRARRRWSRRHAKARQPVRILAVAAQEDKLALRAAEGQLPAASHAVRWLFVDHNPKPEFTAI